MTNPIRRRPGPLRATVRRVRRTSHPISSVSPSPVGASPIFLAWTRRTPKTPAAQPGADDIALPQPDADNTVTFGPEVPITMRTYTARRFDPIAGELDLDIVLHGTGPPSRGLPPPRPESE